MRHQHADVDLIEVFAPDDAALWADAPSPSVMSDSQTNQGSSRRGVVVVGLIAVVAVVVGAIALGGDKNSESVSTTTIPGVPTTLRSLLDPQPDVSATVHYLVDDPSLTAYSADIVAPAADGELFVGWSTASYTGPIVSVQLHDHSYQPYGIIDATRRVVAGVELVSPFGRDTTAIVEVDLDSDRSATVEATGLTDADVVQVVTTLSVQPDGQIAFDTDLMGQLGLTLSGQLGLTLSGQSSSLDQLIFGSVESRVTYLLADGKRVTLLSAPTGGTQDGALMRYASGVNSPYLNRIAGTLNSAGQSFVRWRIGEGLLSLVGSVDQTVLVELSKSVRTATVSEWTGMLYGLRPDYTLGDFETLATGHAGDFERWRAGPQIAERNGRPEFLWWWTVPGLEDVTASTPASLAVTNWSHVDTVVVPGATFVFVSHPNSGGTITVRASTGVEYVAELVQPFPRQSPVFMAVIRVEEPGPIVVERDGIELGQCERGLDCSSGATQ